ncbi:hypothetical protein RIF23_11230 [Lipingzhangella sp. LS1_29]|uniref:Uncharacterized protein n=1 Tax=Lipingzhangella rawalii TaxID=2055835 RepID=A0ABU2H8F4_9ACTN|nr:hypothetical protein [Lipingzhangella rawalii]MDS1270874.1 hypothetical protein [Lipingzhangella rawalii]
MVPETLPALLNDPEPERVRRTYAAMFDMVKLDIARLERAHAGG